MEFQPITTALSRAVALQLDQGTTFLGGGLQLTIAPSAQASNRVIEPALQPIGSIATALGLGLGSSRFLASPGNAAFFSSPGLSVVTGGGSIDGMAAATANTTGRNNNTAEATAVNIGLANLDVVSRGGAVLQIGSTAAPLSASAIAASRSLLSPQATPLLAAQLSALATVRGLEGAAPDAPATLRTEPSTLRTEPSTLRTEPSTPVGTSAPQGFASLPTFYGQPSAAVRAAATLNLDPGPTATEARAVADAKGIEGYRVFALASGLAATPGTPALVAGIATASLDLVGAPPTPALSADLSATAIGIDRSEVRGPGSGPVVFQGAGLALLNTPALLPPESLNLQSLQGIGIALSDLQSNGGDATVVGGGGFAAPNSGGLLPAMDAAGIDRSTILTGSGNDTVMGRIYTEQEAGVDANGDGMMAANVFLDASALTGGQGGFDGIRNSVINTGSGNDGVFGSSSGSAIDAGSGNDLIQLDRARTSSLEGGFGNDSVKVTELALDTSFRGGFGNDTVQVASGDRNRLDGGFGQDLVNGGTAMQTTFVQSNAGAALDAASPSPGALPGSSFSERLTDPNFWAGLADQQKQELWQTGTLVIGAQTFHEDTFSNFDAARGDIFDLSGSLGSLTQNLWESQGALFGVQGGQLVVRDGPQNSQIGLVVGSLGEIRTLGIGAPSLAYATDTRQLMFDADGDWKGGGSQSIGTLNMANPGMLTKSNIQFGSGG
jgi:hypothetical protein